MVRLTFQSSLAHQPFGNLGSSFDISLMNALSSQCLCTVTQVTSAMEKKLLEMGCLFDNTVAWMAGDLRRRKG